MNLLLKRLRKMKRKRKLALLNLVLAPVAKSTAPLLKLGLMWSHLQTTTEPRKELNLHLNYGIRTFMMSATNMP